MRSHQIVGVLSHRPCWQVLWKQPKRVIDALVDFLEHLRVILDIFLFNRRFGGRIDLGAELGGALPDELDIVDIDVIDLILELLRLSRQLGLLSLEQINLTIGLPDLLRDGP